MQDAPLSLAAISELDDLTLSTQLDANQWYSLNQAGLATEHSNQPVIVIFGFQFGMHVSNLLQTLSQWQVVVDAISCYEAHADLPPAFAIRLNEDQPSLVAKLKQYNHDNGVQTAYLAAPPRLDAPGLLVMDMDSTAITIECIDEIARLGGVYDEVAAVTREAMAGKLEFSESLIRRVAKLKGISLELVNELKEQLPLMPGVELLCQVLKQHGWHLAIASGGFVPFAQAVQKRLALDKVHANNLGDDGEQLTGEVHGDIVDAQAKAVFLRQYREQLGLSPQQTLAMGDGANDLIMLAEAGLGVAVHAKPKVVEQAEVAVSAGSIAQILYFLTLPK